MKQEPQNIIIKKNKKSSIPKFIQAADRITDEIKSGKIKLGECIPSIRELSNKYSMSRDTIEKAYKILRDRNLIFSVKGVGNFVTDVISESKIDVFFLINKPSSYKMEVYNAFVDTLGINGHVNMYLYYCDETLFINALKKNIAHYDYFVIMPHFRSKVKNHVNYTSKVIKAIETIPKDKLIILDNSHNEISGSFAAIYQDFKEDIMYALEKGLEKLKKYKKIILVYSTKAVFPYPTSVMVGFKQFCEEHQFDYEILDGIDGDLEFKSKEVYITVEDGELVYLIQQIREKNLVMGKDVGLISYNETPLKALLGITVISTDFKKMGEDAAELILNNKKEIFKNPFNYIERNSI
ncbi:GntR family transcriptional regulator [Flavobacterium cellulosilyticum]|uniref:GntR family transcriptional regulator n=1 Tax=Flavobacterium cellulosilyticum TaxID=2541731 RepID=A0A4R5C847_9FLAO|nr:GntR family transcriptional regulator [Flavobacterium cellulosilyticum]TDD94290.1 GntR family transcriptional regulator [Flavobacterium cellulosilyticum]